MKLSSVVKNLGHHNGAGPRPAVAGVHSEPTFRAVLRRERARVGRNSHFFMLVVFRYAGGNGNGVAARDERFLQLLTEKVRFTDEVGILEGGEVGVLLPETCRDGARVFVEKVRCEARHWSVTPHFTLHQYPEPPSAQSDDEAQLWLDGIAPDPPAVDGGPFASMDAAAAEAEDVPLDPSMDHYLSEPLPLWKRIFDIGAATFGLIVFSPIMLLLALHIKLTSRGPVFFRQERIGYLGAHFFCLKFRTMHVGSDVSAHRAHLHTLIQSGRAMIKLDARQDSRIIPLGQTIRQAGLDELPQLVNIWRGEMSFVGPRPCIPYEFDEYDAWHRMRTESHPGLTGLWQVSGKNKTTFTEMMRFDIAYARHLSFWLDLSITLRTIPAIVGQFRS